MKPSRDPLRWSEPGSEVSAELAAATRALRGNDASPAQLASLGRRLAPELAAPTTAGSAPASPPWLPLGSALLISGLLGLAVFGAVSTPAPGAPTSTAPVVTAASPASTAPPAPTSPQEPAPASASPAPAEAPPAPARKPRAAQPSTPREADAPASELALVQRSQAALDRDPRAALELAEQHARLYPQGAFSQEREVLAMEALVKLKRVAAALGRAERFVREHPESPHARRVRSLLARFRSPEPVTIDADRVHPSGSPLPGASEP